MELKGQEKGLPHALLIPFPLQGHLNPMVKLAQLLHHRGFHITLVITEFMQKRLLKCATDITSLPNFDLESFSDGLPPAPATAIAQDLFLICDSSRKNFFTAISETVSRVRSRENVPDITCVIADIMMPFTITVAKDIGVPCMLLWVASACSYLIYKNQRLLVHKGAVPTKEKDHEEIIDFIPGLKNVRVKDIPFLGKDELQFPSKELERACEASGIILNTFDGLEDGALGAISSMYSNVYTIGPLQMQLNSASAIRPNLFEEESECLGWLDSRGPDSVLYISFGSLLVMSLEELTEFAWGILNSGRPFLWVIRHNLVKNEPTVLPPDLLGKASKQGFITGWCSQERVLNHPSIGGFITHSGWNSTLDSLCAGVPIICWPWTGDQPVNRRYSCTEWGVGMEIDREVSRDQVEKLVRQLMEGDCGKKLKKRAMDWKKLAAEATSPGGSTFTNLEKLVQDASRHHSKGLNCK